MRYPDEQKSRRVTAIAKATKGDNQFIDIATLSLIGLIFTIVEITRYAGTDVLRTMFPGTL